jgi:hypothetical protein
MSSDPLGKSPGSISDLSPDALVNAYPTIGDTPVDAQTDRVIPRQVSSGTTRGIQQLGSDNVYADGGNQQIIVEDSTVPRVLMGKQSFFGEGFYVTKANVNVKTNSDVNQFIFNSNQNIFKVVASGTMTLNANGMTVGSTNSATIAHNLGYVPAFQVYFNFTSGTYTQLPNSTGFSTYTPGATIAFNNWSYAASDANFFTINFMSSANASWGIFTYKYFLLQESVTT